MSQENVERIMAKSVEKYTSSTITSLAKMKQEITQVRKAQYARNVEELLPGYWVLAAGVGGQESSPAAAISLTLPLEEFSPENEVTISALVKDAARKASLQLGHAGAGRSMGNWP